MAEIINLKCPHCSASLEIEDGLNIFFCKYCGSRIVLNDKDLTEARLRLKELEHEKYKLQYASSEKDKNIERDYQQALNKVRIDSYKDKKKNKVIFYKLRLLILAICLVIGLIIFLVVQRNKKAEQEQLQNEAYVEEIQELIQEKNYDEALKTVGLITSYYSNNYSAQKKDLEREIRQLIIDSLADKTVQVNISSKDIKKMNYHDVERYFKDLGFINITTMESSVKHGLFHKAYQVMSISIDGTTDFDADSRFSLEAQIIIMYYPY